jgi:hypothetical protein
MDCTPFWLFVSLTAHKNPQKVLRNGSLPIPHPLKRGGGTIKKVQALQAVASSTIKQMVLWINKFVVILSILDKKYSEESAHNEG